ncbi:hypothetical protein COO03_11880 [Bacillus sp. AFS098217]|uniref:hypothetical protein n=1 Tax=unclassified Bacillus (in: firmicutes) TaxID=185979 RepID=UPI000BECD8A5|nr:MULTISPECIES: hypothetical protein [unclassified Bacillus (in: firmicutes)]PEB52475.1 hypothetical protein COO03_11880 [Bacillus sp. AFS098217]PFW57863.1 hypothetical protein COL20_26050 [Bacillus sp. AFS075034]
MSDFYLTPEDFERAASNGISEGTLKQRVYGYRWKKERAITEPVRETNETGWKEYKEIAAAHGISARTYRKRREKGMTPSEAATTPLMSIQESQKLALQVRKENRPFTEEEIKTAESNGVNYHALLARKSRHWDIETAINTPLLTLEETIKRANADNDFYRKGKALNLRKQA